MKLSKPNNPRPLNNCAIFFSTVLFYGIFNVCMAQSGERIDNLAVYVSKRLKTLDTRSTEKLCDAQYTLILLAKGAFELKDNDLKEAFYTGLKAILDKTQTLGDIRAAHAKGNLRAESFLLDKDRSGSDSRLFFPFSLEKQIPLLRRIAPQITYREIGEQPLCQLQFSYLVSYIMRAWFEHGQDDSETAKQFVQSAFPFLLRNLVVPYWNNVAAWHWLAFYPNLKQLVEARLDFAAHPELQKPSFYRAFYDMDFFTMAIAADLLSITQSTTRKDLKASAEETKTLIEIQIGAQRMFQQRLEQGPGFLFQVGVWTDHPEYQYSLCEVQTKLPESTCPDPRQLPDTNHAERLAWWLESFKSSFRPGTSGWLYYQDLQKRIAKQFIERIVSWQSPSLPILNNFLDGKNGWYRVRYQNRPWGFGRFTLTYTSKWGSWSTLAPYDNRIAKFNQAFCTLVTSQDPKTIKLRTQYYGNPVSPAFNGSGTQDDMGVGTIYDHYCRILSRLGYTAHN